MNGKLESYYIEARDLYVKQGKTLSEISEILNISTKTLGKWKQKETTDWDTQRKNHLVNGLGGVSKLEELIFEKIKMLDVSRFDVDDIKILRGLKSLLKELKGEIDIKKAVTIAMDRFADFIKIKYPHKKDEWIKIIHEFSLWVGK